MSEPAELTLRVGGPAGRFAHRMGRWFEPATWAFVAALVTWVIVMVRQVPCRPLPGDPFPNPFLRMCYTDIPTLYLGRGISTGAGFYTDVALEYPVLIGYFMGAARFIASLFATVSPAATFDEQVAASQVFFQVCAIGLFVCFLATVLAHLRMARGSSISLRGGPVRAWDALFIAASPTVMAAGLINWDLLAVALTSLGVLLWARRHPMLAGALLGLAFAAKFYPVIVLIALTLLCLRAGKAWAIGRIWVGAAAAWLIVNLPIIVLARDGWTVFWTKNATRGADLGSIWYALSLMGIRVPALSAVAFICMAIGGLGVAWLVCTAPRRPRVGQVALLLLVVFLVFNKVYSPQYVLWLLPFVVLARPKLFDVAVWTAAELVYFVCVWGYLEGILRPSGTVEWASPTLQRLFGGLSQTPWLYVAATLLRVGVQLWFARRVVGDVVRPWADPIRLPLVDDPVGGVLDHAVDAAWAAAPGPGRWTANGRNGTTNWSRQDAEPQDAEPQDVAG